MILFPAPVHRAIRSGRITLTFRLWDSCRLIEGKAYQVDNLGRVLIKAAQKVVISAITDEEARRAGYANVDKLILYLRSEKPDLNPRRDFCYRIEFKYVGDGAHRRPRRLSPNALRAIDERVKRMDRRAQGITYSAILKEAAKYSFVKVRYLAEQFECKYSEIRRKLFRLIKEKFVEVDSRKCFHLTPRARQLVEFRENRIPEKKKK